MSRLTRLPVVRWFASPQPSVCVELAARRVTVVAVSGRGQPAVVTGHATEPLPEGALVPALNAANVRDRVAVAAALRRAFDRAGVRPRRVGVVLPDTVGKVSLVRFDQVPGRAADLERLIEWQIRKAAPFRLEEAQVAHTPGARIGESGREFIVTLARRDVVEEYERACADAGAHAGLVDLASFNLVNAVLASSPGGITGDWLLVHWTPDYSTLALMRGADLIFFRSRPNEGEEGLADLVHQTAMYHEDRLGGGGIPRVILAGAGAAGPERAEQMRQSVQERIGTAVESIDPRGAAMLRDRISASQDLLDMLAPPLGLLLRARVA
jgi:Tfp pilus assembly PilM family ATPase